MNTELENHSDHEAQEFVVTTFKDLPKSSEGAKDVVASSVWDGESPFGLGYPYKYVIERTDNGVRIRNIGGSPDQIVINPVRDVTRSELEHEQPIQLASEKPLWITIRPILNMRGIANQVSATHWVPSTLPAEPDTDPAGDRVLKLSSIAVAALSVLSLVTLWLMPPKKVEEELIPEQFAKILLTPALKTPAAKKPKSTGSESVGNVVQVFRSEAVQQKTRSLLNASAAKALLNKSSILDSKSTKAALKGVFDKTSKITAKRGLGALDMKGLDKNVTTTSARTQQSNYSGDAARTTAAQSSSLVSIASEGIGVADGLTKDEVGKVIRKHLGEVRYCYESALARQPGLEGKLVVGFTVASTGRVKDVLVKESSGSDSLDRCIQSRLMRWTFPKPRQEVDVGVSYPFIFKSLGG